MKTLPPLAWSVTLEDDGIKILDESKLPDALTYVVAKDYREAAAAITDMKTRAFGQLLTVFYALALTLRQCRDMNNDALITQLKEAAYILEHSRPTFAFKDFIKKIMGWVFEAHNAGDDIADTVSHNITDYLKVIKKIRLKRASLAAQIIKDGDTIITHCNVSGDLVLIARACRDAGKQVRFYATETRPYFQGRLTAWELSNDGFDVTLVPDNAVAGLLAAGTCTLAITGSDRVALNGDIVNKVGTFQLAIAARKFNVPFYVLVQDPGKTECGADITIEERSPDELLSYNGRRIYPDNAKGYYPAFDCTPAAYITGLITFNGVVKPEEFRNFHTNV